MVGCMLSASRNRQISKIVVEGIAINMMNNFRRAKPPLQMLFHYIAMFKDAFAIGPRNSSITIVIQAASAIRRAQEHVRIAMDYEPRVMSRAQPASDSLLFAAIHFARRTLAVWSIRSRQRIADATPHFIMGVTPAPRFGGTTASFN